MKFSKLYVVISVLAYSCTSNENPKDVSIYPRVFGNNDTLFLEWNFINNTNENLIIPTLLSFRSRGKNQKYLHKEDYDVIGLSNKIITTIQVPYKYLRQIPDISLDIDTHKKIQCISKDTISVYVLDRTFWYIDSLYICPELIVVDSKSKKKLLFMFRPEVHGEYILGFQSEKETDATSTMKVGDSLWKKGVPKLKDIISERIYGYKFSYGYFKSDSITVSL